MAVRVQAADFDLGAESAALVAGRTDTGALVTFSGLVRGDHDLELEHYPGMTERALAKIEAEAIARWPLTACLIIHRHGRLAPGAQIMMVAAASPHRAAAFEAASFLMDYLKTDAPFWKKTHAPDSADWVAARAEDDAARARWQR